MRSLWKGAVSFGLVNIPVRMYAATENKSLSFNQLHRVCHTPILYAKRCPTCNSDVAQDEIVRGYEYDKGRYVIVEDEDLADLPIPSTKTVEIVDFINLDEVDPIYYEKSYYLEPAEGALKPYSLLRQAMVKSGKVAMAKITIRTRESLCCLRVYGHTLTLATMHYPDEVRSVEKLASVTQEEPKVSDVELKIAVQLIESLEAPFDPGRYKDDYREALLQVIRSKAAGREIHEAPRPGLISGDVVDLMAALEASLKAVEKERQPKSRKRALVGADQKKG